MSKITKAEFNALMAEEILWAVESGIRLARLARGRATLRQSFGKSMLRPGGTISGPTMMALADLTMYVTLLSAIGKVKLAVTTNFNINFLRRPFPGGLVAEGKVIKLGKRLAVMEVTILSEGHAEPVAHATGTYSIPPASGSKD
ncbi:MAG: PaaI family thioesterase [Acidimicrobiia bacterium]|nr:PaaI family thioesterase [Acidimicrobiia bacterium]